MRTDYRHCERCSAPAYPDERFCLMHRTRLLLVLLRRGYLQRLPRPDPPRPTSAREDVIETRAGCRDYFRAGRG